MKKPDKTKSQGPAEPLQDSAPLKPKKDAAQPGVIAQTDIGSGDGTPAIPVVAETKPMGSALVGDGTDPTPPATARTTAKTESKPAAAGPFDAASTARDAAPGSAKDDRPHAVSGDVSTPPRRDDVPAATAVTSSTRPTQVRKTGFWPVFLGGVVAAGLGSAATILALPNLPAGWLPEQPVAETPQAPQVDMTAIQAEAVRAAQNASAEQLDALRADIAANAEQITALRAEFAAPADSGADTATATPAEAATEAPAVASVEDLDALRQQLAEQAAQIQELTARPQIDPQLAERVQTLAGQADTLEQQIQTAAQAAQAQINEAQAEAERLQQAAQETTRRAEAVAAIASLQTALDRGVTPDEARQTLEGAGLEAPEALTRDVPSLDSLQSGFPEAARAALRTTLRNDSAAGNGNLLTNFLRAQTGARSVEARDGDDPDAILSRADEAVQSGRIGDAVTEIEALPEAARSVAPMADWLAGAVAYRDAQAALSDLSAPSN